MMTDYSFVIYHTQTVASRERWQAVMAMLNTLNLQAHSQLIDQKISQKWLKTAQDGALLIDDKGNTGLVANGMTVSPNWSSLQQRVIKAGKKTELLLKAMRLQAGMSVVDATAGFGHDSLILASTGAHITMIEQQPFMYILLVLEEQHMHQQPNWQKLLQRLTLVFGDAAQQLASPVSHGVDRVYLDPMFPQDSYKSAVNKHMQVLHHVAKPPDFAAEQQLLQVALGQLSPDGKVVVKRPKNAPFLANVAPIHSTQNDLVRYDEYQR
jgi:16S rRNA (guanine1516-N2)-methyltransferase